MNLAHLHLIMNHLPVIGVPVALTFLAYGLIYNNVGAQKFSLLALVTIATATIPIYLTGESAENVVEHLSGVSESLIDQHEDAATVSLILNLFVGGCALASLMMARWKAAYYYAVRVTCILSVIAAISLGYVANLGGKIRHSEIRADGIPVDVNKLHMTLKMSRFVGMSIRNAIARPEFGNSAFCVKV